MVTVKSITPKDLKARLDAGEDILIIDVREDWEVARSKIEQSLPIPMNDVPDELEQIPHDKPVVLQCQHGSRSQQVTEWLQKQGYENVINLEGGIVRWSKEVDPSIRV